MSPSTNSLDENDRQTEDERENLIQKSQQDASATPPSRPNIKKRKAEDIDDMIMDHLKEMKKSAKPDDEDSTYGKNTRSKIIKPSIYHRLYPRSSASETKLFRFENLDI